MFTGWALFFHHSAVIENAVLNKMAVTSSHNLSSAFLAHLRGETSTQIRVALV